MTCSAQFGSKSKWVERVVVLVKGKVQETRQAPQGNGNKPKTEKE